MSKVRYIGNCDDYQVRWGSNDDPRGLLIEGKLYDLACVEVHTWHTKLLLQDFPGKMFNSANFEDVDGAIDKATQEWKPVYLNILDLQKTLELEDPNE